MADKSIFDLPEEGSLEPDGLLVSYQNGGTKAVRGEALKEFVQAAVPIEEAEASAQRAEQAAQRAEQVSINTPYIGETGNWFVWSNEKRAYIDSGVDASLTLSIADVTMIPFGSAPYITNSGTDTDPVFHLFIPSAKNGDDGKTPVKGVDYNDGADGFSPTVSVLQISGGTKVIITDKDGEKSFNVLNGTSPTVQTSSISGGHRLTITDKNGTRTVDVMDGDSIVSIERTSGTGAAGTIDTYTVTTYSGGQYHFTVYNGADGKGSGDMLKTVYDPNNKAQDIFAYADGLAAASKAKFFSVTLPVSGWSGNSQTVSNAMFKAAGFGYIYNPDEASYGAYVSAMARCGEVTVDGQVRFYCDDTPTDDITVDFMRIEVSENG